MNATIKYWSPNSQKCKYASYSTLKEAKKALKSFHKAEIAITHGGQS